MKYYCYLLAIAMTIPVANARREKGRNSKAHQYLQELHAARDAYEKGIDAFLNPKDSDHDGCLSEDEFTAGESDKAAAQKRFQAADTNHDGQLTRSEIAAMLGLQSKYDAAREQAFKDERESRNRRHHRR